MSRAVEHDGTVFRREGTKFWWMCYRERDGTRRREWTFTEDWQEAHKKLRERLQARDGNILHIVRQGECLLFGKWTEFFMENYSKPPFRTTKAHIANDRAVKHLNRTFANRTLANVTADEIELYFRDRLRQRIRIKTRLGYRVEFPVMLKGLFRPHYVSWPEQQRIETHAPEYLRNIVRIISETGLRVYKELLPMKKDQVDFVDKTVWIPDSKTPNGVAELPLTGVALQAFRGQMRLAGPGEYLFPSDLNPEGHQRPLRTVWRLTLKRAGVSYFRLYDLRSTYATRLRAGEWPTSGSHNCFVRATHKSSRSIRG